MNYRKLLVALACIGPSLLSGAVAAPQFNVLMIVVDDLRPQLGCYGDAQAVSPNIDRLAAEGVRFTSAYVQQSVCAASRSSMLTGLRPDSTGVTYDERHFRLRVPNAVTLPEHFRRQGYHTQAIGKIFHGKLDDRQSWSVPTFIPPGLPGYGPAGKSLFARRQQEAVLAGIPKAQQADLFKGPAWEEAKVDDRELPDGQIAYRAIAALRERDEQPFFLAVGFYKPHLPFVAPEKYWRLHDPSSLPIASNSAPPANAPECAGHTSTELRKYANIPAVGPVSEAQARSLTHGYYACVSYMDAQVGRVLAELDRLKLRDNTIVVLWGDHGWHLGEHGLWCKHTNFESAVRIPLIISVPGAATNSRSASGIVELVDLFPTLVELAGLPQVADLEGVSFVPLLGNPSATWKKAAFSQYPRVVPNYEAPAMGRAVRTDSYRYVEWTVPDTDFRAVELYDERRDPAENQNLAGLDEYHSVEEDLQRQLAAGWRAALPAAVVANNRSPH